MLLGTTRCCHLSHPSGTRSGNAWSATNHRSTPSGAWDGRADNGPSDKTPVSGLRTRSRGQVDAPQPALPSSPRTKDADDALDGRQDLHRHAAPGVDGGALGRLRQPSNYSPYYGNMDYFGGNAAQYDQHHQMGGSHHMVSHPGHPGYHQMGYDMGHHGMNQGYHGSSPTTPRLPADCSLEYTDSKYQIV